VTNLDTLNDLRFGGDLSPLYVPVYNTAARVTLYPFTLTRRHEMRIDLVAYDVYGDNDHAELLMAVNNVTNPFAVREGDVLYYGDVTQLQAVVSDAAATAALYDALVDASKKQKVDADRVKYKSKRAAIEGAKRSLPPTLKSAEQAPYTFNEGNLYLHPGV
jgi:hypothetical protein